MWTEVEHGACLDELYDSHFRDKQPVVRLQEDVHFKLLQEDVKRNEVTADTMRAVGSMAPEWKRWRGLLESLYWNATFEAAMRIFRLLRQIVPVMREWQHFNEFDFQDMPDFDSRQVDITPARWNATWLGPMLGNPHGASGISNQQKWEDVTLPEAKFPGGSIHDAEACSAGADSGRSWCL